MQTLDFELQIEFTFSCLSLSITFSLYRFKWTSVLIYEICTEVATNKLEKANLEEKLRASEEKREHDAVAADSAIAALRSQVETKIGDYSLFLTLRVSGKIFSTIEVLIHKE